jgi:hypothetical protein
MVPYSPNFFGCNNNCASNGPWCVRIALPNLPRRNSFVSKVVIIPSLLTLAVALCSSTLAHSTANAATSSAKATRVSIQAGQARQFRSATGSPSAITWYVNGVVGGSTLIGKVTPSGIYTAPATAPDTDIALTAVNSSDGRTATIAQITVLDDPAILEAQKKWIDGAVEAAAIYGCTHPTIQQATTESVAEALKVYLLTADKSSCLILSPISADPESNRYSYAWGGNVDGVDIYYISDVSRPRILLGTPAPGE